MPAPLTRVFPSRIGESRAAGAHLYTPESLGNRWCHVTHSGMAWVRCCSRAGPRARGTGGGWAIGVVASSETVACRHAAA